MDEIKFTLNSPLTEEEWDLISDVDFDNTDEITFYTKHGKEVTFVKRKTGRWMHHEDKAYAGDGYEECSCCKWRCADWVFIEDSNYCPSCGAKMEGGEADG